ncbi:hypothetical protein KA344_12260 [bacterium]|nr:hypothetical protein [bacterium]
MAGREISNDLIERKSSALANILDTGDGVRAANILRDEAQNLSANSFNRVVERTSDKEQKSTRGQGFDLEIVKDGTLIITGGHKGETVAGHMKRERPEYPSGGSGQGGGSSRERQVVVECPKNDMLGDIAKGAALLGGGTALFGGDKKNIVRNGVIGAVGGAVYNHEKDKDTDCVIVDDGRGRRR